MTNTTETLVQQCQLAWTLISRRFPHPWWALHTTYPETSCSVILTPTLLAHSAGTWGWRRVTPSAGYRSSITYQSANTELQNVWMTKTTEYSLWATLPPPRWPRWTATGTRCGCSADTAPCATTSCSGPGLDIETSLDNIYFSIISILHIIYFQTRELGPQLAPDSSATPATHEQGPARLGHKTDILTKNTE